MWLPITNPQAFGQWEVNQLHLQMGCSLVRQDQDHICLLLMWGVPGLLLRDNTVIDTCTAIQVNDSLKQREWSKTPCFFHKKYLYSFHTLPQTKDLYFQRDIENKMTYQGWLGQWCYLSGPSQFLLFHVFPLVVVLIDNCSCFSVSNAKKEQCLETLTQCGADLEINTKKKRNWHKRN